MKKILEQVSIVDYLAGERISVQPHDMDRTFQKLYYNKATKPSDVGINDNNIVTCGPAFPANPDTGQLHNKDGIVYKYTS